MRARHGVLLLCACLVSFLPAHAQRHQFPTKYDDYFRKYSKRFFGIGFDWRFFKAQALAESNLVPDVQSRVGAIGLMQLMPSTFQEIQTENPEFQAIDDAEWNIASGIYYNRRLWRTWKEHPEGVERLHFTFGSYNAGPLYIRQARTLAEADTLDPMIWQSIAKVAPKVRRWRYRETLNYIQRIDSLHQILDAMAKGRALR